MDGEIGGVGGKEVRSFVWRSKLKRKNSTVQQPRPLLVYALVW